MKVQPEKPRKYWPHCWHYDSRYGAMFPRTSEDRICCYCGKRITLHTTGEGHGPHLPLEHRQLEQEPMEECPKRRVKRSGRPAMGK